MTERKVRLTSTQARLCDLLDDGKRLFYWPGVDFSHFRIGDRLGHYDSAPIVPPIPHTTVRALARLGVLVEVRRFDRDATSSGKNAAIEYRRLDEPTPSPIAKASFTSPDSPAEDSCNG